MEIELPDVVLSLGAIDRDRAARPPNGAEIAGAILPLLAAVAEQQLSIICAATGEGAALQETLDRSADSLNEVARALRLMVGTPTDADLA